MNIYQKALSAFGVDHQLNQAQEELAELIVAINKHRRAPTKHTRSNVVEELIDVLIMLEQLTLVFNISEIEADMITTKKRKKLDMHIRKARKK